MRTFFHRLGKCLFGLVKISLGALFSQLVLGALLLAGWTAQILQRSIYLTWWKQSSCRSEKSFQRFLHDAGKSNYAKRLPDWFLSDDPTGAHQKGRIRRKVSEAFRLTLQRISIGLTLTFHSFLVTSPGLMIIGAGWYAGWQNSFNKGYEHAAIGPLISILGMLLLVPVLIYLPLAQASLISKGRWKAFYDLPYLRKIHRLSLFPAGLAGLWGLLFFFILNAGVMVANSAEINEKAASLPTHEVVGFIKRYYLFWGFPFVLMLGYYRHLCGRVYALGVLRALKSGSITEDELDEGEWKILNDLRLLQNPANQTTGRWFRMFQNLTQKTLRIMSTSFLVGISFLMIVVIMVTQFWHFRGLWGWLHQPMLGLPWFQFVPNSIRHPSQPLLIAGLILLIGWGMLRISRKLRKGDRDQEGFAQSQRSKNSKEGGVEQS